MEILVLNNRLNEPENKLQNAWKDRALKAEKKLEKVEWLVFCAQGVADMFPHVTLKNIWYFGKSLETLRDAIKQVEVS